MITVIRPVLVVPGGIAREEDAAAISAAIPAIQAWFDQRGGTRPGGRPAATVMF